MFLDRFDLTNIRLFSKLTSTYEWIHLSLRVLLLIKVTNAASLEVFFFNLRWRTDWKPSLKIQTE